MADFDIGKIEPIISEVVSRFLIPHFEELGMNATGQWKSEAEARNNEIWGMDYTGALVNGLPPGTNPPIEALTEWAKAKFGYSDEQAERTAWAVQTKIRQSGTSWYEQGGSDLMEILESDEVTDFINSELKKLLEDQMKEVFLKNIKQTFER